MYGDVAGVAVGSIFKNRRKLFEAGQNKGVGSLFSIQPA
jgi:hypothetical protein